MSVGVLNREVARVLSEDLSIEVLIIDTSNEIAGDGDVAHRSVGASRRMMVQSLDKQASVMIRGLQNHTYVGHRLPKTPLVPHHSQPRLSQYVTSIVSRFP